MTDQINNVKKAGIKKWTVIVPVLIACIFFIISCLIFLRVRHGIRVKPDNNRKLTESVICYRQDEEDWAMDSLGDSSYTMKSSGCLVTCIASAVSAGGEPVTPGELNALFSENKVYDSEGNIQWSNLAELEGYHVVAYEDISAEDIAGCLSEGHYPIVRVRMYGMGNYHYVLIVGADEGEYLCMDPLKDDMTKLSDYLGLVYAVRCVWKENDANVEAETMGTSEDQTDSTEQVSYTNVGVIDPVEDKEFEMQDWQEAYAAYIEEEDKDWYNTYSLIYVNEDDIPELVIDTGFEAGGCRILTFHNGEIDVLQTDRLTFFYIEGRNLLNNAAGHMGFYYDYIYAIENGKWVSMGIGEYWEYRPEDVTDYSDITFIYEWNGKRVDEERYQKSVDAVFDMEQAVEPQEYDILGEMVSRLRTGDVSSSKHRYELFVGDVTWDEARAFCEERGGYLATLITEEEYERIQNHIEENGLTDMMFWVGSRLIREPGYFGFYWLEPGQELSRFDMLDHYNALWRFAYDEPDYEGGVYLFYDVDRQKYLLADAPDDILSSYSEDSSYAGKIGFICEYDE